MATTNQIQYMGIDFNTNMNNRISIPQYTSGKTIAVRLTNYSLPQNCTVRVLIIKPSGLEVLYDCKYESAYIYIDTTLQMTAELGLQHGQLQIFQNGKHLYSYEFILEVTQNLFTNISIQSASEYGALTQALDETVALLDATNNAVEDLNKLSDDVIIAERIRQVNEFGESGGTIGSNANAYQGSRVWNESRRMNAETTRQSNETTRMTSEAQRIAREGERQSKETIREDNEKARQKAYQDAVTNLTLIQNTATNINNLTADVKALQNLATDDSFVKKSETYIDRGKCKLAYDSSLNGLVISFMS